MLLALHFRQSTSTTTTIQLCGPGTPPAGLTGDRVDRSSIRQPLCRRQRPTDAGGYIGFPLLILTGFLAFRSRRSPRMQLVVVLFFVSAVLSLGPHLAVDGSQTMIPLPFWVVDRLPFLDNILPSRIAFGMDAFLAALIASGLDDMRQTADRSPPGGSNQRWRSTALASLTLAVLVVTQVPQSPYPSYLATALPAQLLHAIPPGNPVAITYPYDTFVSSMEPMEWQADDRFTFRLLGGYGFHLVPGASCAPGPGTGCSLLRLPTRMEPAGLQQFLLCQTQVYCLAELYGPPPPVGPELVTTTRTSLSKYHVRLVIVDRSVSGSGPVMELFSDALGPPMLSAGKFSMWADWHGRPSHEQFLSHLVTSELRPANHARCQAQRCSMPRRRGTRDQSRVPPH